MEKMRFLISCVVLSIVSITYANIVEINSNITTNQIWTANNTYHITAGVNVTALLVIEPGTNIKFSSSGGLIVNNGGTLISAGTPNSQIHYTSDADYGWGDYNCAIEIQETASPATKIIYNYIDCANIAILTKNIQLDTPIQNNILFYNNYGIMEYGTRHTDIINNLIYYSSFCIYIYMESEQGAADANSIILIENNTCDYQDYGVVVEGTANINNMGQAKLINNIVGESAGYGICIINGYIAETVSNTGYYGNTTNKYGFTTEFNPVQATVYPFDATGWHLVNGCPFINAGKEYIEQTQLIGTTTNVNGTPDSNKIDIGYHYSNWNYNNAGTTTLHADFDGNFKVDYKDLRFFANYWLFDYNEAYQTWSWDYDNSGKVDMPDLRVVSEYWLSPFNFYDFADFANQWQKKVDERLYDERPDLNGDKIVNFKDFAILANEWKKTGSAEPNIIPTLNQNPNNISGNLQISINSINNPMVYRVFLMLDGTKYCEFGDLENGSSIGIDTERFANGGHSIKIVCMCGNQVIASVPINVTFNNTLNNITMPDGFVPGKDLYLYALGTGNYSVEIKDIINNSVVYNNSFLNGINAHISASAFSERYGVYKVTATGTSGSFSETIGRKFRMEDYPQDCNSKMVISIGSSDLEIDKERCWQAALKAGVLKQFNPILLRYQDCTWDNLSYCLKLFNVKIWYHCAHGNYKLLLQPPRQCIETKDGWVFSYLKKDLNPVPPDYQELWYYEKNHSITELGFWNTHKLNWVQFNACYSGHTPEFPYYLGITEGQWPGDPIGNKIFIGWNNSAYASDILMKYNQFEENYWDYLRQGEDLDEAIQDSLPPFGTNILSNIATYGVIDRQLVWFRYPNIN
jgi:hypothetical protein